MLASSASGNVDVIVQMNSASADAAQTGTNEAERRDRATVENSGGMVGKGIGIIWDNTTWDSIGSFD